MSTTGGRRVLRRVTTVLTGGALLAASAAVALGGDRWTVEAGPVEETAVPVAATTLLQVCAGPPRLATAAAGQDLGYDEFDPEGSGTTTLVEVVSVARDGAAPAPLRLWPGLAAEPGDAVPSGGQARLEQVAGAGEAVVLEAEPVDGGVALAAGTSVALTETGDLRGLVASACQSPTTSAWLVGGSTEPGDSTQLVLSNAGDTPASVTLSGWGSTGALDLSTAGTVLVPPGGQQVVLLEALVADPRPALHVEASGGSVTAVLQDSRLRGLVPGGTDLVTPSVAPEPTVVVPGIHLGASSGQDADAPVVRIVNPGEETATAALVLLGADGEVAVPGADALVLDPGAVVDVSLTGMPEGAWSAVVTADRAVTAAALVTTVGRAGEDDPATAPVDRAWVPATAPLTTGLVALPGELATAATLVAANPATTAVEVELVPVLRDGTRGTPVTRTLEPRSGLREDVTALGEDVAAVELRAPQPVHASVMLTARAPDGALMSAVPLTEDPATARAVTLAPAPASLG